MSAEIIKQLHEETIPLLENIKNKKDDHFKIFNELQEFRKARFKVFEERIPGCKWEVYYPTSLVVEEAQEVMYRKAITDSKKSPELIKPLRDFFLQPFNGRERYDLLAALGDSESVQLVFDGVVEQFGKHVDDYVYKSGFDALLELVKVPHYTTLVIQIIRTGFDKCIASADGLVNDTIFNLLGKLCVLINDKESAAEVYKAFIFAGDKKRHYGMNTVASRLAVYLTALDYKGEIDAFKAYVDYYSDAYEDEEFVVWARYAYWWFSKDTQEALDFLDSRDRKMSLGIVAAFLADMNETKALPVLQTRINELTNPVTIEAFKEAINRLEFPQVRPSSERMIWMFGFVTPKERVLGEESDNVFIQRANLISSEDHGEIFEADESTPED
jgi:hypothetical protein